LRLGLRRKARGRRAERGQLMRGSENWIAQRLVIIDFCKQSYVIGHFQTSEQSEEHTTESIFHPVQSLDASRPAILNPSSPSTSTHHPSPPLPLFPPIAALKLACAYSRTSASKLPGCSHTAGMPASFASLSNCLVTAGGVMTDRE